MKIEKISDKDFETIEETKKYEIYEFIYKEYEKKVEQNERQFELLQDKEVTISRLKRIVKTIIDEME